MLLSVVFITRDRKDMLMKAIESCVERKIADMEIIILDNASKNQKEDMEEVQKYLEETQVPHTIIKMTKNLGVAGGRAQAFQHAKGKYVFFFDDDAVWVTEDPFDRLCEIMNKNQRIAAIAVKAYETGTERYLAGPFAKGTTVNTSGEILSYVGCGHMLRKDVYLGTELYPPNLGYGSEELYASLWAWLNGYVVFYAADVEMLHLRSPINRLTEDDRNFNIITNIYIIRKLLFPKWVVPFETLLCHLRLLKNGLYNKKWRNQFKDALCQRANINNEVRMSNKVFWNLIKKFGFVSVI